MTPNYLVLKDPEALALEAAHRFISLAQTAISTQGRFTVALAGGSSPKRMHELLAERFARALDWSKVFVFFGDERFVSPDDPLSNYLMALETLLTQVRIPEDNVFPYVTLGVSATEAAELYAKELEQFFAPEQPNFDLICLGMGEDGHTASLFPGHPLLEVTDRLVAETTDSPKPPATRLTFTYKTLHLAKHIFFLVTGRSKADALERIFKKHEALPAARVRPPQGKVLWLLDQAAAALLLKN
jgi:6-phosphogluconolactonase